MSLHDTEDQLRELLRETPLEPPLRPGLAERVRVEAGRRRRRRHAADVLCVLLAAGLGVGLARGLDARRTPSPAVSASTSCAGTVVTAAAGTQRVVLSGQGAQELNVQLGKSVQFRADGPCSARIDLVSDVHNLVSRSTEFPPTGGSMIADAAMLGTETAQVTVRGCRTFDVAASCGDPIVVGVLTVRITSQPTP
jgi:hypothetical protein